MSNGFSEEEIQVLIGLIELSKPITTPNNCEYKFFPKTENEAREYFGRFAVDWSLAIPSLIKRGHVEMYESRYNLTETGLRAASLLRLERPPLWYTYKSYYIDTAHSIAHSVFCEKVFGRNLCQDGFADIIQLDKMIEVMQIGKNSRILDLGCGNGMISEYISDKTGAFVLGIDYIPEAIQQALERTKVKSDRLCFSVGNMDDLKLPENYFDAVICIDTLYMPNNLDCTIESILRTLKKPGEIAVFYSKFYGNLAKDMNADSNELAQVFRKRGIEYGYFDFSRENYELLCRKNIAAKELKNAYILEGNMHLYEKMLRESIDSVQVYDERINNIRRYLYHARIQSVLKD